MLFFSQAVCQGAINTHSSSPFPGHLGCCTRSHRRAARGDFTRCRFVYAEQQGQPGCEGLPGLDKAGLRHRSGRPAMDTTESAAAESAHSPARPPSRSRCPPPAQPGYLSARIHPRASPSSPRARRPRSPRTAWPRLVPVRPLPQPSPYTRRPCPMPLLSPS